MTDLEKQQLEQKIKQDLINLRKQAIGLAKNPLVQFAAGFIGMDLFLRRR